MNAEKYERLIKALMTISASVIIIGALLKIMNNPIGSSLITIGFISEIMLQWLENNRLTKIIKTYENGQTETVQ